MEALKGQRTALRARQTRKLNSIEALLKATPVDVHEVRAKLQVAESTYAALLEVSEQYINEMLSANVDAELVEEEIESNENYQEKFLVVQSKVDQALQHKPPSDASSDASFSTATQSIVVVSDNNVKRGYNIPKLQLKKFGGEIKEWLGFWSNFKRIHEDKMLSDDEKLQYLDMAMKEGSRAQDVLNGCPKIGNVYQKAIEALTTRFGAPELQVEVYMRELHKLVAANVNQSMDKLTLPQLYDQLESHLRALECLGASPDKSNLMLVPMVESCLPVPVLRAWRRSPESRKDGSKEDPPKTQLHFLMEFLRCEVENEERITLATEGFSKIEVKSEPSSNKKSFGAKAKKYEHDRTPTAAGLVNESKQNGCAFCVGAHGTESCPKAHEMTLHERKEKLKQGRCCFRCLKKGCFAKNCQNPVKCRSCGKDHHTLVCRGASPAHGTSQGAKPEAPTQPDAGAERTSTSSANTYGTPDHAYLQTAMATLVNGKKTKTVRIAFDTGSQTDHIKTSTAREMGYEELGKETLNHDLFGGVKSKVVHGKYKIKTGAFSEEYLDVLDQDMICNKLPSAPKGPWMAQLKKRGIWLEDMEKEDHEIEVLIGVRHYRGLLTGRAEKLPCGLDAVETKFGWTVMGAFNDQQLCRSKSIKTTRNMMVTTQLLNQMCVPDLWKLETIGIMDPIDKKTQQEEEAEVLRNFGETVRRRDTGRYIVKLPWRGEISDLPTNRVVAEKRLLSATKKLGAHECGSKQSKGPLRTIPESAPLLTQGVDWNRGEVKTSGYEAYDKVFQEWLEEGIIEEIPEDNSNTCHYLPHRAVFKEESATTKVRPVFDASCKVGRAPALNECLETGPNLIDLIPSIFLRFREGCVGVISDIRKAFLMIEVDEEDRDFLRFLWWEDPISGKIKVLRHKRVVFGVNSSPFLLGAVIQHHLAQYQGDTKDVAEKLQHSLYVDNCVTSVNSEAELERFRDVSTTMMLEAEMDLRLWQDSYDVSENVLERTVPVLGMQWDRFEDVLFCDPPTPTLDKDFVTKRQILSITQQVFDPLGIVAPVTVLPRILLQEAWAQKKGWDEPVEEDARRKFLRWIEELPLLFQIQIPRCFRGNAEDRSGWSIHCFTDASSYAYAAVIFLRCVGAPVSVQLLLAKNRVAPIKKATIPRLELIGCLIGARLTASVKEALKLEGVPCYYWSDSSTALSWIRRNDDWGTFVGNRVREILSLSEASQWNHVPGKVNPADLPSRGCSVLELSESTWWEGPEWLKLDPEEWPSEPMQPCEEDVLAERKKTVTNASNASNVLEQGDLWYLKGRSGYAQMLRRACYVTRFVDRIMKRTQCVGALTPTEISAVEKRLVRQVQQEAFGEMEKFGRLRVFKDAEGILRVKTKLLLRQDQEDFKMPMLLPGRHPFVLELVREAHTQNCHGGIQFLISKLREKFWIIHTRKSVARVIHNCQRCKRFAARNVEVEPAAFPEDRVRNAAPFEIVGVDLAGPLFLRDRKKAWIVLFTCAVFRAVHLELVTSLDTGHFLLAFRRFVARRGRPSIIYSDNGTNFRGADNLFRSLDWESIKKSVGADPIQWKFSPPSAPWWGGFWERLVRSVKGMLVRMLGKSSVYYEELSTLLCDIEGVINQRPLTVMTEDSDDLVALTPAMFLLETRQSGLPELEDIVSETLQKRFRYRQELVLELKKRFRTEYLANLLEQAKQRTNFELKIGDLVLIGDDNKKRVLWQLGRIQGFRRRGGASTGPARVAVVKTEHGVSERPVRRLYPLELGSGVEDQQQQQLDVITRLGRRIRKPLRFR